MNISIIGTGYVGLVTGACFAEFGLNVICMDNDTVKIEQLKHNVMPIYEPGIAELVSKNVKEGRLRFTSNMKDTVENSSVIFIAVGTPPLEDGSADLQYVIRVAHDISAYLNEYKIIVNKSTVPVGTGKKVRNEIRKCLLERRVDVDFDVVSNPEFLREGLAIDDFTHPDRIILGTETQKAADIMCELYRHINTKEFPIVCTSIESAELIKYASNAFLAMKISYVNQIAELCENVGADIHDVTKGIGLDKRIGTHTLQAGPGFGGSCFPKDTRALIKIGNEAGVNISLIRNVIDVNKEQRARLVHKIKEALCTPCNKTIAILGLAFKPNTDDMRESAAISMVQALYDDGLKIKAYDPQAMKNAQEYYFNNMDIYYAQDEYDAIKDADAIIILTEWEQFGMLDFDKIKQIAHVTHFFDYRNMYQRKSIEEREIWYAGVGV